MRRERRRRELELHEEEAREAARHQAIFEREAAAGRRHAHERLEHERRLEVRLDAVADKRVAAKARRDADRREGVAREVALRQALVERVAPGSGVRAVPNLRATILAYGQTVSCHLNAASGRACVYRDQARHTQWAVAGRCSRKILVSSHV